LSSPDPGFQLSVRVLVCYLVIITSFRSLTTKVHYSLAIQNHTVLLASGSDPLFFSGNDDLSDLATSEGSAR